MNEEFRTSIRLAMSRSTLMGITCRKMTREEEIAHNKRLKVKITKLEQIPFSKRVEQVKRVQQIAQKSGIRIIDACDVVGITFSNYRSVKSALAKGLSKRP